jgi:putative membrane protein
MRLITAPPVFVHIPYCGLPPSPSNLWWRWNLDPVLIFALCAVVIAYAAGTAKLNRDSRVLGRGRQAAFYCGWLLTAAALISPLCPLSVSLFAARVGQHMFLTLIAAPLVAAGNPATAICALFSSGPNQRRTDSLSRFPLVAAASFALLLWFWHTPFPYALTFESPWIYWTMHLTLFGSALWLWACLLDRDASMLIKGLGASVISSVQMGFLGAIITFAREPLYTPHLLTTIAWGLTSLQDQQLGGVIRWAPGCAIFLSISVFELWSLLEHTGFQKRQIPDAEPRPQVQ